MHLFPADGIFATILSYGQMLSLFLVLMIFEGVLAAKTESRIPGLIFIFLVFGLAVGMGILFEDIHFFLYMQVPVMMCLGAFWFSRRNRALNKKKGMVYGKDGVIEDFEKNM